VHSVFSLEEVYIILDKLPAHKTRAVREFLANHPHVRLHVTTTYSSWLNQVEIWFGKIERDVIARSVFTSVRDLARKLRRYINAYSTNARPIQWQYSVPTRRIRTNDLSATGHHRRAGQPYLPPNWTKKLTRRENGLSIVASLTVTPDILTAGI
jgi:hypothetical protein